MRRKNVLHVVFGASGGLGNAVIRKLAARGKQVRAVNRSGKATVPEGVEVVPGDAADVASAGEVCRGATVVYNCVNPDYARWPELFPPILEGTIAGAASADATLVFADNLYMYGPVTGAMTEDLPSNPTGHKGRTRARMADRLMEAHHSGEVKAVIARASDFFGPAVSNSAMGEQVFKPAIEGKTVNVIGNIDAPHTYTYIDDFAGALITLGDQKEALGEIWHAPNAETITTRQFLKMIFEEAGTTPKIRAANKTVLNLLALFSPLMRELKETFYQFNEPFIVDHSKYERAFGSQVTPHREAIRQTVQWFREHF